MFSNCSDVLEICSEGHGVVLLKLEGRRRQHLPFFPQKTHVSGSYNNARWWINKFVTSFSVIITLVRTIVLQT
jgi:hypothetical protein